MGDGGFWHNGLSTGISGAAFSDQDGVLLIMNNGYSSATGQQYLPSTTAGGQRTATATIEHALANMGISWVRSIRSYSVGLMARRLKEALDVAYARAQGDRGRRRMPARAPAPHPPADAQGGGGGRARRAHALRRRRGDLHGRPFLHPAVGLPVADGEAQSRSAAARPGGACQQRLRRLRRVRRGGGRGGAVPVLLPRRHRAEPARRGTAGSQRCAARSSPGCRRARRHAAAAAAANERAAGHGADRRPGRRRRRRADRLARRLRDAGEPAGAGNVDPGCGTTHRRHHVLCRDFSGDLRGARRPAAAVRALSEPRRDRCDARVRGDRGGPRARRRICHARPHHARRRDAPHLCRGGKTGDGGRPLRHEPYPRSRADAGAPPDPVRPDAGSGDARAFAERGAARHRRRVGHAADCAAELRGCHPRGRHRGRGQSRRLRQGVRAWRRGRAAGTSAARRPRPAPARRRHGRAHRHGAARFSRIRGGDRRGRIAPHVRLPGHGLCAALSTSACGASRRSTATAR